LPDEMKSPLPACVKCTRAVCHFGLKEETPDFCPSVNKEAALGEARELLEDENVMAAAREASRVEGAGYGKWPRVQEVIEFAKRLDIKRIGIAFCVGLRKEAKLFADILEAHGFEAVSVCCKVGGEPKENLGLEDAEKVIPGVYEAYCNPIAQALILDGEGCELNVLVGLCVGHDSLFIRHAQALTTVLIAKDRVTGHNPAAALYTSHSYYNRLKNRGG
jgi:uncharacterized metal-binding protein